MKDKIDLRVWLNGSVYLKPLPKEYRPQIYIEKDEKRTIWQRLTRQPIKTYKLYWEGEGQPPTLTHGKEKGWVRR